MKRTAYCFWCDFSAALVVFFLIMLHAAGSVAYAEGLSRKTSQYPPYPDVWGLDPGPYRTPIVFAVWLAPNGDFLLQMSRDKCVPACGHNAKYVAREFFAQHERQISSDDFNHFKIRFTAPDTPRSLGSKELQFSDGSTLSIHGGSTNGCSTEPFPGYYELKDVNGKTILRKSIFVRLAKPKTISCPSDVAYYKISVDTDSHMIVPLGDDTFLIPNIAGRYVIRFDRQFRTRFPYDHSQIFIVDTDAVDAARERAKTRCNSYPDCIDDEIWKYLNTLTH